MDISNLVKEQAKASLAAILGEHQRAIHLYNHSYNNAMYTAIGDSVQNMTTDDQIRFMNLVIDAALETCGMSLYRGSTIKLFDLASINGHYTVRAVVVFLKLFAS